MKKKTQVLFSSFAAIAMSASVCAGATYALFTSETQVNVAVQAGTVEIVATVDKDTVATKSGVNWDVWNGTATTLTDGSVFSTFENGGGATFTDNSVNLQLMTPGDQVTFTIELDNKSNVNAMYRTVVLPTKDTGLLSGLEITFTDVTTAETEKLGAETFVGAAVADWAQLPEDTKTDVERKIQVTITLPEEAGNEYQGTEANLIYYVEAVQGNADINNGNVVDADGYTLIQNATDLWRLSAEYANPNKVSVLSATPVKYRLANDINLNDAPFMAIGTKANPFECDFDGNGKTISNFTVSNRSGAGLFGYVGSAHGTYPTIENVTVKDAVINTNNSGAGIAGVVWGNVNNCTVENVTVNVTPYFDKTTNQYVDGNKAGGVVAYLLNGTANNNIVQDVEVNAYRDLGGVVGMLSNDGSAASVQAKGNKLNDVTVEFVEGYVCVEDGEKKAQNNIAAVSGRTGGKVDVAKNAIEKIALPESYAATEEAFAKALAMGGKVSLAADLVVNAPAQIPTGVTVELDLGEYTLSAVETSAGRHAYALNNNGTLIINGGRFEARGIYNGYTGDSYVGNPNATMVINDGTYIALDTNGGAAVFNYGNLTVNGGTFEGYANLNNRINATMVINDGTFNGGIHYAIQDNGGTTVVNGGDFNGIFGAFGIWGGNVTLNDGDFSFTGREGNTSHCVYISSGSLTIAGGTFQKVGDIDLTAEGADIINKGSNDCTFTITGGTFYGVYGPNSPVGITNGYNGIIVTGGMFDANIYNFHTVFPEGYTIKENKKTGMWLVVPEGAENINDVKTISSVEEFLAFADDVNVNKNNYLGVKVQLTADIDLDGATIKPIGNTGFTQFMGLFDGNGKTISNFVIDETMQSKPEYGVALFGWIERHDEYDNGVQNLTIKNATIKGCHYVAGIVGWTNDDIVNCHVVDSTISCVKSTVTDEDGNKAGAIVGVVNVQYGAQMKNCSAINVAIDSGRDAGQLVGASKESFIGEGNTATNVTVTANGDSTGANIRNELIGRVL